MKESAIQLMLVEDETIYSKIILFQLSKMQFNGFEVSVNHVSSITEMKELGEFLIPDIILLDLGMPESSGSDTFNVAREMFPESAIVILSGTEDDNLAANLVRSGAQDYLVKTDVDQKYLKKTIEYTLERFGFLETSKSLSLSLLDDLQANINIIKEILNDPEKGLELSKETIHKAVGQIERAMNEFRQNK